MADLETFRRETRAWLLANAPPSMRRPLAEDEEPCWGGRKETYPEPRGEAVARRHGRARLDGADLAEGVRRRRLEQRRGDACCAQEMAALRLRPPLVGFGLIMIGPTLLAARQRGAEARAPAAASCAARSAGARATRSPARAPTSPACRRARCSTATTSSSPGRRSGPRTPTRPTGCSCSCAPIPTRPSTRASRSCSWTWPAPA